MAIPMDLDSIKPRSQMVSIRNQHANRVIIAFNRKAGASESIAAVSELSEALRNQRFDVETKTDINDIVESAISDYEAGKLRVVVAAGGDGTIGLIANRLPKDVPLTILPLGTENLLAKHLGIPNDTDQLIELIQDGITIQIDVGKANGQFFLVMASCGFDAEVVHQLHERRSGNIRHLSYAKPILRSLGKYRYPTLRILVNDDPKPIKAKWSFVFNAPQYAMQLPIVDDASCLDGELDLCTFRSGKFFTGLVYLFGIVTRRHRNWKDTQFRKITKLLIESDEHVPFQLDGDPGGHLPLEIEIIPARICMMVPRKWLADQDVLDLIPSSAATQKNISESA